MNLIGFFISHTGNEQLHDTDIHKEHRVSIFGKCSFFKTCLDDRSTHICKYNELCLMRNCSFLTFPHILYVCCYFVHKLQNQLCIDSDSPAHWMTYQFFFQNGWQGQKRIHHMYVRTYICTYVCLHSIFI